MDLVLDLDKNSSTEEAQSSEDQSSNDAVEVCDNCGEEFDSDDGDNQKAKLPCKCRLHEYSCLMKRNKDEKCTGCGHCICNDCMRLWGRVKQLQSKLVKKQNEIDALQATIDEMSNPKKKRKI